MAKGADIFQTRTSLNKAHIKTPLPSSSLTIFVNNDSTHVSILLPLIVSYASLTTAIPAPSGGGGFYNGGRSTMTPEASTAVIVLLSIAGTILLLTFACYFTLLWKARNLNPYAIINPVRDEYMAAMDYEKQNPPNAEEMARMGTAEAWKLEVVESMGVLNGEKRLEGRIGNGSHSVPTIISIGLATKPYPNFRHIGFNKNSVGYHSNDGRSFHDTPTGGRAFSTAYTRGDIIGCGYDPTRGAKVFHDYSIGVSADGPCELYVNVGGNAFAYAPANERIVKKELLF
ncbi:hypothetical protein BC829DRAFT_394017 [Chytridium lagenaria]|nr:hypothetical protein BC829DRAFT_394017 [Chytridium lagenaria]